MWRDSETDSEEERMLERDILAAQRQEEELLKMLYETGNGTMQINGQRIYGAPPPRWNGPPPPKGCEIFIGKIPRDVMEEELLDLFSAIGTVYQLRLMMDFSGCNRGFAFVQFSQPEQAEQAILLLNNHEIRPKHRIGVLKSIDNCRLFIGGIPKTKSREEIQHEIEKLTEGVRQVIVYSSITDKTKNRGFAFVEYENHRMASKARRKLIPDRIHMFGKEVAVDWAETEPVIPDSIMSRVTVLYVRNLSLTTTEQSLRNLFDSVSDGNVTKVKMMRDFAFIHFESRSCAEKALQALNKTTFNGTVIEVVWAKPVKEKLKEAKRKNSVSGNSSVKVKPKNPKSPTCDTPPKSVSCSPTVSTVPPYITQFQSQQANRTFTFQSPIQLPSVKILPAVQYVPSPPTTGFINYSLTNYKVH